MKRHLGIVSSSFGRVVTGVSPRGPKKGLQSTESATVTDAPREGDDCAREFICPSIEQVGPGWHLSGNLDSAGYGDKLYKRIPFCADKDKEGE